MMPNRTVTCGDCFHADICKQVNGGWFSRENIAYCKGFKDRTKYVEVVRCKDCKFYDGQDELADIAGWTDGEPYCFCDEMMEYMPRKGFCHKGERKDNAE